MRTRNFSTSFVVILLVAFAVGCGRSDKDRDNDIAQLQRQVADLMGLGGDSALVQHLWAAEATAKDALEKATAKPAFGLAAVEKLVEGDDALTARELKVTRRIFGAADLVNDTVEADLASADAFAKEAAERAAAARKAALEDLKKAQAAQQAVLAAVLATANEEVAEVLATTNETVAEADKQAKAAADRKAVLAGLAARLGIKPAPAVAQNTPAPKGQP